MKTPDTLISKVELLKSGNNEVFTEIYEESYKYLHTCVIHIVRDEDVAQDMLQDAYVEIYRNINQLRASEDFLGWAATIANRKCYQYLKKNREILMEEQTDDNGNETDYFESIADDESFIPENIFDNREKIRLIRGIIDDLTDVQRACVIGFYYNEQKQDEIAEELGIPVNTVKSHLNRAKAKIKDAVGDVEKKQGVKLYSVAPFMLMLFLEEARTYATQTVVPAMGVKAAEAITQTSVSGIAGTSSAAISSSASASKVAGSIGMKLAGMTLKTKVIAGITAVAVTAGGVTGSVIYNSSKTTDEITVQAEQLEDIAISENVAVADENSQSVEAEKAEEENIADEQNELLQLVSDGIDYLHGTNNKEYDPERALACFEEADEKGNKNAAFLAGYVMDYVMHGGVDGDEYKKALSYYEKCKDENIYAKAAIGYMYKEGHGVERDKDKAQSIFEEIAPEIDLNGLINDSETPYVPEAKYITAELCFDGALGDEPDYAKTMELLDSQETIESAAIYNKIGYMYLNGIGVEIDYDKALENYRKSVALNDRLGMHQLGYMYDCGYGLEQDYEKAMEYYTKAADLGYARSYNQIGLMYSNGKGVKKDYVKAREYFEIAVQGDDKYGYNNLGMMYLNGEGVSQDYKKAAELFEKAAEQDDEAAIANLGYMYYNGLGRQRDKKMAEELFSKAAALGDTWAQECLEEMGVSKAFETKDVKGNSESSTTDYTDTDGITAVGNGGSNDLSDGISEDEYVAELQYLDSLGLTDDEFERQLSIWVAQHKSN